MLEVLQYIFSNGWIFCGFILIIYVIGEALIEPICKAIISSVAIKYGKDIQIIDKDDK